ncbi:MAG: nuclear transport factor 2 family protein [Bacteroidota bacterium]|jgi:hypothetical protein
MKKAALLLLILTYSLVGFTQSRQESEVISTVEKLRLAMISGIKEDLESVVHDSLSYGHSNGTIEGKYEFVEKIVSGKSDFVSIEFYGQTISVQKNIALVRHSLIANINDGGKPSEIKLKILLVFIKTGKDWKLLARQAVKLI